MARTVRFGFDTKVTGEVESTPANRLVFKGSEEAVGSLKRLVGFHLRNLADSLSDEDDDPSSDDILDYIVSRMRGKRCWAEPVEVNVGPVLSAPSGNAFCPTGPEGGQDNSCPPSSAGGSSGTATAATSRMVDKAELRAALKAAKAKISAAPVPSRAEVAKARAELELAKRGEMRAGGQSQQNSRTRAKQREELFDEFGGAEKGYVVCPWTGTKMHHTDDPEKNPEGYEKFERGKIFVKAQGGGYQLTNLIPESFAANRARNAKPLRPENLD